MVTDLCVYPSAQLFVSFNYVTLVRLLSGTSLSMFVSKKTKQIAKKKEKIWFFSHHIGTFSEGQNKYIQN